MKKNLSLVLFGLAVNSLPVNASVDCITVSLAIKNSVALEKSKVLEIVSAEVSAAPGCACEIVKAAIESSNASVQVVAAIVEAASTAAPEQMRLVSQCAVAVAPDALEAVQAVIAKLDPNSGKPVKEVGSAKDSKSAVGDVVETPNPLDFPKDDSSSSGSSSDGWAESLFPQNGLNHKTAVSPPKTTEINQ